MLHIAHAFGVVGVFVLAGLAHFAPGIAYPGVVDDVGGSVPRRRIEDFAGAGVRLLPEVAGPHVRGGYPFGLRHHIAKAFGFDLVCEHGIEFRDVGLLGLDHSDAAGGFRDVYAREAGDVRWMLVVFGQRAQQRAVLGHPLFHDEGACADEIFLHPLFAHSVIGVLAIDARAFAVFADGVFKVERADDNALGGVHNEGVVVDDARFAESGRQVAADAECGIDVECGIGVV